MIRYQLQVFDHSVGKWLDCVHADFPNVSIAFETMELLRKVQPAWKLRVIKIESIEPY